MVSRFLLRISETPQPWNTRYPAYQDTQGTDLAISVIWLLALEREGRRKLLCDSCQFCFLSFSFTTQDPPSEKGGKSEDQNQITLHYLVRDVSFPAHQPRKKKTFAYSKE